DNRKEYSTLKELIHEKGISSDLADYWDKECELNPSNPRCLVYDD
ncbi:virion host shutoff-like protein, partial [Prochlorococcus marinus str. MU1416]|nr:virion host shutoff-like protein [Prochlorococcus marinus str. MU1416]